MNLYINKFMNLWQQHRLYCLGQSPQMTTTIRVFCSLVKNDDDNNNSTRLFGILVFCVSLDLIYICIYKKVYICWCRFIFYTYVYLPKNENPLKRVRLLSRLQTRPYHTRETTKSRCIHTFTGIYVVYICTLDGKKIFKKSNLLSWEPQKDSFSLLCLPFFTRPNKVKEKNKKWNKINKEHGPFIYAQLRILSSIYIYCL